MNVLLLLLLAQHGPAREVALGVVEGDDPSDKASPVIESNVRKRIH